MRIKLKNIIFIFQLFFLFNINAQIKVQKNNWKNLDVFKEFNYLVPTTLERVIIHETGHLVVAKILNANVNKIEITRKNGGYIAFDSINPILHINIFLAGYLTEKIIFGDVQTGCYGDLDIATQIIMEHYNIDYSKKHKFKFIKVLQNHIQKTENIILQNLNLITNLINFFKNQPLNKSGIITLNKQEINKIFNKLIQTS